MSNYLPHFVEASRRHKLVANQKLLLKNITDSHNSLVSLILCYLGSLEQDVLAFEAETYCI
jgi:hypothetical protein